ncbi:MAG: AbgT family transporter [Planctomycetes bacterium]|nr:AbgT family transporter [Planctomycetota bacterium]
MSDSSPVQPDSRRTKGILDFIERVGNALPEPALIFAILAAVVICLSAIGSKLGWQVQPVQPRVVMVDGTSPSGEAIKVPKLKADGRPEVELVKIGEPVKPKSLLTSEGVYWMFSSMLRNFTTLPAMGLIFVAMLGIGLAEKFGFFSALMRGLAVATPRKLLTPVIVLIGANSSVASDAGYIILPPLAAALYMAVGRPPIVGVAAAFAGVSGGFGGGFFPTGGDGVLAGFAQDAARVIDPTYNVNIVHNLFFKSGSAIIIMLAGWFVTDKIVEPRLIRSGLTGAIDGPQVGDMALKSEEKRALSWSLVTMVGILGVFAAMIFIPGAPLHGDGQPTLPDGRVIVHHAVTIAEKDAATTAPAHDVLTRDPFLVAETTVKGRLPEQPAPRWSHAIVPIIFFAFLIPGMVYGRLTGVMKSQKDFIDGIFHGIRSLTPVLAIAFFMGQFVNYFAYTKLDRMLAYSGGSLLVTADLPVPLLIVLFVLMVVLGDFAISGMLSKFGVLAPIFIPMFMMVGKSPELTTAAYRIGDSVVNIITPMNSYLLIILVVLQKYRKEAGLGTLISLMLPYSIVFFVVWTGFLLIWYQLGYSLGPGSPVNYVPSHP